jgi:hypothetical protein
MTDTELSVAASADQPPIVAGAQTPEERKAKRNAKWYRWAGIFVAIAALIRAVAFFLPHGLADCDGSDLQSSLRSAIETKSSVKLTSVSNIQTVSRSGNSAVCRMHVNVSDGSQADITYQLDLDKGDTKFQVTNVK